MSPSPLTDRDDGEQSMDLATPIRPQHVILADEITYDENFYKTVEESYLEAVSVPLPPSPELGQSMGQCSVSTETVDSSDTTHNKSSLEQISSDLAVISLDLEDREKASHVMQETVDAVHQVVNEHFGTVGSKILGS